ncbi:hypothetical protein LTR85_003380 [Meristemomyces frigidus]|nr:hypothetical protein LTR85_003380 [Meristemomyces frigidus]
MEAAGLVFAIPPIVVMCVTVVQELRKLTETMQTANKTLLSLLSRVERMRLYLDSVRALAKQLRDPKQMAVMVTFNDTDYRQTLNVLRSLVDQGAAHSDNQWWMKTYWVTQRTKATQLLRSLQDHEAEITLMLSLICAQSNVRTEKHVSNIVDQIERQSRFRDKYDMLELDRDSDIREDDTLDNANLREPVVDTQSVPLWPGYILREGLSDGTRWANDMLGFRDLTAAEIARTMGFSHLSRELAPVIYHPLPPATLARLESQLHATMRQDLKRCSWSSSLVLPDLNALTELKVPNMWFPIQVEKGYHICLDGRELVISKVGLGTQGPMLYRITETEVYPLERAVMFDQ